MSDHNTTWGLLCPFLTDDPMFARGVAFGMLWKEMNNPDKDVIEDYCLRWLQDQITLAAGRLGWKVEKMEPWDDDWFFLRMTRDRR